jgi:DNA-binding XRE family transcriptional regulator
MCGPLSSEIAVGNSLIIKSSFDQGFCIESPRPRERRGYSHFLLKRRMDLKLFQRDVAGIIGVTECTINNWENGEIKPETKYIPRIIDFLGYTPFECPVDILMLKSRFAVDAFV